MKKNIISKSIFFLIVLLLTPSSIVFGATMTDYCQVPPFIGTGGSPNILMVNDVSGSMGWAAYGDGTSHAIDPALYDSTKGYEGYFDPQKSYVLTTVNGITAYYETSGTACTTTCSAHSCVKNSTFCANGTKYGGGTGNFGCSKTGTKPFGCCTAIATGGDCNSATGNNLNYLNMHRIDLMRWALTGGNPASCTGTATFNPSQCDPELWNQTGNSTKVGSVCGNTIAINDNGTELGGCILLADNGIKVAATWDRVNDGLSTQFHNLLVQPRLGVMTFDTTGVNAQKVYLGDFIASNNNSASFPYSNFITNINSQGPGGGTPTGPAMWDALNYFAMRDPQFGGFPASHGGDNWKNPLFVCDGGGGNNCIQNTCARNYVLLMSDGEWNVGTDGSSGTTIGSSPTCTVSTTSTESDDPVVPAYCMHKGFTNLSTSTATKVSGVYTVGLFMAPGHSGIQAMENIAMYGSFENSAQTWPDSLTGFPPNSPLCGKSGSTLVDTDCGSSNCASGSLCAALPGTSPDWDLNGDGAPDTFFSADDALLIKQHIMDAIQDILSHATSGTAASVLASGEGSGANLVQATYYPRRKFFDASIMWTGGLQNLWYYIDPTFNYSSIREDDGDKILNLITDESHEDYVAQFYFDVAEQKAKARTYSSSLSQA